MNRKGFLQKLLTTTGILALGRITPPCSITEEIEILACQVAGYQYHFGPVIESKMISGAPVRLVREPYNVHDYCAIAIYFTDIKIGYIPMEYNFVLARLLSGGIRIKAHIGECNPHLDPWERVRVYIPMEVDSNLLVENEVDRGGRRASNREEIEKLSGDTLPCSN